jgi:signal transduction histidine kinase
VLVTVLKKTDLPNFKRSSRRLLLTTLAFVVLTTLFLILNSYQQQIQLNEEKELARLEGIASTLALQIDGAAHDRLLERYPEMDDITANGQDSVYASFHSLLRKAQDVNALGSSIYTMVYDSAMQKFCFAVSSSDSPYWLHAYRDYPQKLLDQYETGGRIEMYADSNGMWLSAFRPITNQSGNTVAILQVDQQFDRFIEEARGDAWSNIALSLLLAGIIILALFFVLRYFIGQQQRIHAERAELLQMRTELLSNISHDLRTPLSNIQGYLETVLLLDAKLDKSKRDQYLDVALRNTDRLKRMVDELFELSKLESEDRTPEIEPFALNELVLDNLSNLRMTADEKGITFAHDIPTGLPFALADIALIDRVLQNVLSNAIKYTPAGGHVKVSVQVTDDGRCVRTVITDDGPGIPQKDLPHIFERFHRAEHVTQEGSGLGLAIVKSILNAHQASFGMDSVEGEGTTFWFELPLEV